MTFPQLDNPWFSGHDHENKADALDLTWPDDYLWQFKCKGLALFLWLCPLNQGLSSWWNVTNSEIKDAIALG